MRRLTVAVFLAGVTVLTGAEPAALPIAPQAPPANAPPGAGTPSEAVAADLTKLFEEKAGLGSEQGTAATATKPVIADVKALATERQTLAANQANFKSEFAVAQAGCSREDLTGAGIARCKTVDQRMGVKQKALNAEAASFNSRLKKLTPQENRLLANYESILARRAKVDLALAILAKQHGAACKTARDVSGRNTDEAVAQCMQVIWDGAKDPGRTIDSGPTLVVVPNAKK